MEMALVNETLYNFYPPTYSSTLMFALLIYKLKTKRERGEPLGAVLVGFMSSSSSLFSSSSSSGSGFQ